VRDTALLCPAAGGVARVGVMSWGRRAQFGRKVRECPSENVMRCDKKNPVAHGVRFYMEEGMIGATAWSEAERVTSELSFAVSRYVLTKGFTARRLTQH
jgi:hypothetical protein